MTTSSALGQYDMTLTAVHRRDGRIVQVLHVHPDGVEAAHSPDEMASCSLCEVNDG